MALVLRELKIGTSKDAKSNKDAMTENVDPLTPTSSIVSETVRTTGKSSKSGRMTSITSRFAKKQETTVEDIEYEVKVMRWRIAKMQSGFVEPNSKKMRRWDMAGMIALLFVALVTPFELAFLLPHPVNGLDDITVLYVINRVCDVYFLCDIVLTFFIPTRNKFGKFVYSHRTTAAKYMKGWFGIDFVASMPYDLLQVQDAKMLRMMRLLKSVKVLRVLRSSRIFKRWESKIGVKHGTLSLIKVTISTLIVAHWLSCVWALTATNSEDIEQTWIACNGYTSDFYSGANLYAISFYWGLMTLTTVGYGDITPCKDNVAEYVVGSVCILIGAASWAYMTGVMCGLVSTFNPGEIQFRAKIDELNTYMGENNFPHHLREAARDFFTVSRGLELEKRNTSLFRDVSPQLQDELVGHLNSTWMHEVSLIQKMVEAVDEEERPEFLNSLTSKLQTQIYAPREPLPRSPIHIIRGGLAASRGKLLARGTVWGELCLLEHGKSSEEAQVQTLSYVTVAIITPAAMEEIYAKHPAVKAVCRSIAVRSLFRQSVRKVVDKHFQKEKLPVVNSTLTGRTMQKTNSTTELAGGSSADVSQLTALMVKMDRDAVARNAHTLAMMGHLQSEVSKLSVAMGTTTARQAAAAPGSFMGGGRNSMFGAVASV